MSTAYQGVITQSYTAPYPVAPLDADPSSGAQRAASQAVIGSDSSVTATLPFQGIGSSAAPVADSFVIYTPPIPT